MAQLGNGSVVVNGNLVAVPPVESYAPTLFGPVGGPEWPQAYSNVVPPSLGSPVTMQSGYGRSTDMPSSIGASMGVQAASPASRPFSIKGSPLPWAVLFLLVGFAGLRYIHFAG